MSNRTKAPETVVANPPVTFSLEALNEIVGTALAKQRAEFEATLKAAKPTKGDKVDYDALAIKAFRKAGFGEIKPRIDTKTYNLWLADGFKVRPGEHATRVRQLRLFHRSQVEAMTAAEKREAQVKLAAKTADKLPVVSPVSPVAPAPKAKKAAKVVPISANP